MKQSSKIIKDDHRVLDRVLADLKGIDGQYVKVGFLEGDVHSESHLPLAGIAAVHEFGSPKNNIPERSFIRAWVDSNIKPIQVKMERLYGQIIDNKIEPLMALKTMGVYATGGIKSQVRKTTSPALSPKTIARKGSSQPLIDTGIMRASVRYVISRIKGSDVL